MALQVGKIGLRRRSELAPATQSEKVGLHTPMPRRGTIDDENQPISGENKQGYLKGDRLGCIYSNSQPQS
uniref:hypothetical protein n=1 Tax=Paenibacillus koleovorans TaxID=121608 RepID=UPI001C3F6F2D